MTQYYMLKQDFNKFQGIKMKLKYQQQNDMKIWYNDPQLKLKQFNKKFKFKYKFQQIKYLEEDPVLEQVQEEPSPRQESNEKAATPEQPKISSTGKKSCYTEL